MKSEVIMYKDDFTFEVNRIRYVTVWFHFLKKKIKKPAWWRTISPLMSSSTMTTWPYFVKEIQRTHFYKFEFKWTPKYKKAINVTFKNNIGLNPLLVLVFVQIPIWSLDFDLSQLSPYFWKCVKLRSFMLVPC